MHAVVGTIGLIAESHCELERASDRDSALEKQFSDCAVIVSVNGSKCVG